MPIRSGRRLRREVAHRLTRAPHPSPSATANSLAAKARLVDRFAGIRSQLALPRCLQRAQSVHFTRVTHRPMHSNRPTKSKTERAEEKSEFNSNFPVRRTDYTSSERLYGCDALDLRPNCPSIVSIFSTLCSASVSAESVRSFNLSLITR